jgi:phospholipid/cholesterol/gamma-HCH transport system substrate-binding protein
VIALLARPASAATAARPGRPAAGLGLIALVTAMLGACVLVHAGAFSGDAVVTVRGGGLVPAGADVILRGLAVGRVRSASPLRLALDADQVPAIPDGVQARILPRSLAGERIVELVAPPGPGARPIHDGAVIARDRSDTAVALEHVLDELLPVLRAIDPAKLAVTLNALATALDGRGDRLGDDLARLGPVLAAIGRELPPAKDLAVTADAYASAAPELVAALRRFGDASSALASQREQLAAFSAGVTSVAQRGAGLLSVQGGRLVQFAEVARPPLEAYARYSPEFGCLLRGLADLEPRLDGAFAGGELQVSAGYPNGRGPRLPRYPDDPGPDCHGLAQPPAGGGGSSLLLGPVVPPAAGGEP